MFAPTEVVVNKVGYPLGCGWLKAGAAAEVHEGPASGAFRIAVAYRYVAEVGLRLSVQVVGADLDERHVSAMADLAEGEPVDGDAAVLRAPVVEAAIEGFGAGRGNAQVSVDVILEPGSVHAVGCMVDPNLLHQHGGKLGPQGVVGLPELESAQEVLHEMVAELKLESARAEGRVDNHSFYRICKKRRCNCK